MRNNKPVLAIAFFLIQLGFSQEEKLIHGKITVKNATPKDVHVINVANEKEAISDANGEFSILAKVDDVLIFSAPHLDYNRKLIEIEDYNSLFLTIEMTSKVILLEEVEIDYSHINAVSLGILTRQPKHYTPAERRLYASQSSLLDSFLNDLSGRTSVLENGVEIEKKEMMLEKLADLYSDVFYNERLKISKEYIKAFQYYMVENKDFAAALNSKNKFMITFLMIGLAEKYNALFNYEKK